MDRTLFVALVLSSIGAVTGSAVAQDWETVPLVRHDVFQAVHANGGSAYTLGFPVRLRGIVLNNPEDWLDPTPDYTPDYVPWYLGGQWEIFVQAYDDPAETYDDADFGGSACWMGQNYGNLGFIQDPAFSYTDEAWLAELERINHPDGPGTEPLRAGDWVEVRARGGLPYQGKMNVNEMHSPDPAFDFEIVILQRDLGLPAPAVLTLADLLEADGYGGYAFIWDPARQVGGERFQATRLKLLDVQVVDAAIWGPDALLVLTDGVGREMPVHIGRNGGFARVFPPAGPFAVTGILNQESFTGIGGYSLLALHPDDFDPPLHRCGDLNCDGVADFDDIDAFILAIEGPDAYAAVYPDCRRLNGDLDYDADVDFDDIDPFVAVLSNGGFCP